MIYIYMYVHIAYMGMPERILINSFCERTRCIIVQENKKETQKRRRCVHLLVKQRQNKIQVGDRVLAD